MFKNILFATTASAACDNAAKVAFDMAEKNNANIHVFHVCGVPTHGHSPFVIDIRTGQEEEIFDPDYTAWVKEELKNTYSELFSKFNNYQIECAIGSPHREILRKARKEKADLIIMGAHTRIESQDRVRYRNIIGNTMQQVAKAAFCPVFIINRPCNTPFKTTNKIVYGTDFSKASYAAFQFACKTAMYTNGELHLIHVVDLSSQQFGRFEEQAQIEKAILEAKKKIDHIYLPEMSRLRKYQTYVREGIPYIEFLKYVREENADLIVLAHHAGKTDIIGSMTEQVCLRATCPVVSINKKPSEKYEM